MTVLEGLYAMYAKPKEIGLGRGLQGSRDCKQSAPSTLPCGLSLKQRPASPSIYRNEEAEKTGTLYFLAAAKYGDRFA